MSAPVLERLWTDYVVARAVAEKSSRIEDGIAAGRAWGEFLRAFENPRFAKPPHLEVLAGGRP